MRLDSYLAANGLAESRTRANEMIRSGIVFLGGVPVTKPSAEVGDAAVEIRGEAMRFVGRGALKLEYALDTFALPVSGVTAVDVGASTGGFTQCLLERGAARVYAVDAGHDQLHPSLRADRRVISMEGVNARTLSPRLLGRMCDLAVMDVSFISQALLYSAVSSVLTDAGILVSLIKPQFEAGRQKVGKGGIVRDTGVYREVITSLISEAARSRLYCRALCASPITGGDGNREFLACFDRSGTVRVTGQEITAVIGSLSHSERKPT